MLYFWKAQGPITSVFPSFLEPFPKGKVQNKKSKKKLTSVSFMYVCVAENAELLVFFYFFLHLFHRQFSFRREVLNHHTPPPIPKLSSITKTRILFVFLPKKVPVFCPYFYKNEPVWRIGHTALPDFSLNPSIRQLLFDVEDGLFAASHKSSRRLLEFSHQFSGEIPAVPAAVSAGTSGISKIT